VVTAHTKPTGVTGVTDTRSLLAAPGCGFRIACPFCRYHASAATGRLSAVFNENHRGLRKAAPGTTLTRRSCHQGRGSVSPGHAAQSPRLVHYWLVPLFAFEGHEPEVSATAWVAPTATLVGDVRVEDEASIWYGAVLRADFGPIVVRRGANVQDGSVLHGSGDPVTEIGNGATVLDGAIVGRRALVAAGCTVPPGMAIADGMLATGVPAQVLGELTPGAKRWVETNPSVYRDLARRHAAGIRPV
jgi:carbonic anhydrase/acetyltransferase-like protein (isoleucine patch superfamily)